MVGSNRKKPAKDNWAWKPEKTIKKQEKDQTEDILEENEIVDENHIVQTRTKTKVAKTEEDRMISMLKMRKKQKKRKMMQNEHQPDQPNGDQEMEEPSSEEEGPLPSETTIAQDTSNDNATSETLDGSIEGISSSQDLPSETTIAQDTSNYNATSETLDGSIEGISSSQDLEQPSNSTDTDLSLHSNLPPQTPSNTNVNTTEDTGAISKFHKFIFNFFNVSYWFPGSKEDGSSGVSHG